jgi:hypothetical protein
MLLILCLFVNMSCSHIIEHIFARYEFFFVIKSLLHHFSYWVHFVIWVVVIKTAILVCSWSNFFLFVTKIIDIFKKLSSCFLLPGLFSWLIWVVFWLTVAEGISNHEILTVLKKITQAVL